MSGRDTLRFPQSVIERLGFYVYVLRDPEGRVFYIGKGTGNRVFAHVEESLEQAEPCDKLDRIRAIHAAGKEVAYEIVRHGLTEDQAFEVESTLIDWEQLDGLTNSVAGHHAERRGRMSAAEIIATYAAQPVTLDAPCLLVVVNRRFVRNTDAAKLYEITRGNWVLGSRKNAARFALAVFRGLVRAAYRIDSWEAVEDTNEVGTKRRWRFTGAAASELAHLIGGDVTRYLGKASQNPVRYVNC